MDFLFDMVKNIVVYMIVITVVMNLISNSTYKKYVSVFTGMLLILIIIKPVISLFHIENKFDYNAIANQFAAKDDSFREELIEASNASEDRILSEYEKTIKSQLEVIAGNFGFRINKLSLEIGTEDDNYGKITGMDIYLETNNKKDEKDDSGEDAVLIKKIQIEEVEIGDGRQEEKDRKDFNGDITMGDFRKETANLYGVEEENIKIYGKEE